MLKRFLINLFKGRNDQRPIHLGNNIPNFRNSLNRKRYFQRDKSLMPYPFFRKPYGKRGSTEGT
jgi:hypothetical protein